MRFFDAALVVPVRSRAAANAEHLAGVGATNCGGKFVRFHELLSDWSLRYGFEELRLVL